ncbi:PIG-L family deacetylase [Streptomyces sp. DH12]|uniref:PIG-L family deacetylase n=1 Tax=Streptomyces sp. DH12 TaxID=2857010 RepID=UPI001E5DA214|nr:PIG-L family deacetylase [Streptomyces sp. DH12]
MSTPVPATSPIPAAPTGRPVVFLIPHADDELLWMWLIIAHHVLAGRHVVAVLASDGASSTVHAALNGTRANGWWPASWHYPAPGHERYAPLTTEDFVAGRDAEFVDSCVALGVHPDDIHLTAEWRQTEISEERARELILWYHALYPDAGFYTTWWGDSDPNHAALGRALRGLVLDGTLTDARWAVRRAQGPTAPGAVEYVVAADIRAQALRMARCAAQAYRAWAPERGRYAIGYHSVPGEFAAVESGGPVWIVKNP